jgi:hypothetical protein
MQRVNWLAMKALATGSGERNLIVTTGAEHRNFDTIES